MAACKGKFIFSNRGEYEKARTRLCSQMLRDTRDPNCLRFEDSASGRCAIYVMERCSDVRFAIGICRGYHGIFQEC